ncbi:hypothetical protein [Micromonospora sp. CPCC 205556]|uniref:hypothetical protein n=1 Tax=Micromonospora sp. CPCC 205556 TaxID=3122398 RepID=UPI002FF2E3DA
MTTDAALQILKVVTSFLRNLSGEEIERLVNGSSTLAIVPRAGARPGSERVTFDQADIDKVRADLMTMGSREEGLAYLEQLKLTRNALHALTAAFDLPVRKTDKVEDLRNNLIEATIGFRLRSHAIREHPTS